MSSIRLFQEPTIFFFFHKRLSKIMWCPHNQNAVSVWGSFDVSTGLRFFKICHSAVLNKNRRGYDAGESVPLSQGLPAVAAQKW